MNSGCLNSWMDDNTQLRYLHNCIHQLNGGYASDVLTEDSLYGIPLMETYYNNAPVMLRANIEDKPYNIATVPSITPTLSFSSSSPSTVIEDQHLGFKDNGGNKMVIKTVHKNLSRNKKKTNMVKGQWTLEEDRRLIKLVDKHGIRKWSYIAQMLPGRVGKQCRERWHNHLRPNIKKDSWTEEEDRVLIEAHKEIGNKWAQIAKRLPGRTENSLKNHWNTTKRRQFARCCTRTTKNSQGATNNNILQDYIKSLSITINHNNMPPPPPSAVPAPTPAMHVSVMPPENENILKQAKIEKVDVEVEDVMLPSYDSFADMYSLLFDGGSVFDVTDNIVFGKIDEFRMSWSGMTTS